MKKFIKENWFQIVIIICALIIILSILRIEEEIRMIHRYTADTADILKYTIK